jgi:glycine/D-amino acid oxidase-like deaminating enzyme
VDATVAGYSGLSFWHDSLGPAAQTPRPPLARDTDADIAIVGGGLTGLWTAWYLLERDPGLKIVVLEKQVAGFGASGRNGGWCSALFPRSTASLVRAHGREAALGLRRAMVATVDEVGRAASEAGVDADYVKGGTVAYARSAVQLAAAHAEVDEAGEYGVDAVEFWDAGRGADHRIGAAEALGASFDPACARVHPAKLVRGLAAAVERAGATIAEQTEVLEWDPAPGKSGRVTTTRGVVTADRIVLATEGYGATLRQTHRRILPLYSLMIATEPLPDEFWNRIGLRHGQTFTDFRHLLIYGQRTADNRFAFGGRGARYHWGSSIRPEYDRSPRVFEHLHRALRELFPSMGDVAVTHRWGGPLGVPRDWHASVNYDPSTRIASAGGYVGDGLSTTNLAGRTLADLLSGADTELTRLPWVNHRSPSWEVEPLRFAGANAGMTAMAFADAEERVTGRRSLAARIMGPLVGH